MVVLEAYIHHFMLTYFFIRINFFCSFGIPKFYPIMITLKNTILLTVTVCCTQSFVFGQSEQQQQHLIDSVLTAAQQKKSFNGNVLVADKGKVIFRKSYGIAEESTGRKLNPETVFELASVSKQFTAMGIVQLQKHGKLQYDDPIAKYIPELAFYKGITIRNLLQHTGGLPDYMELFEEKWDKTKFATNDDVIKIFAQYKPDTLFAPGVKYEYSNTGYALLGAIIERVSKKTFGAYLKETIFKPLKMEHTFVYRSRYQPQKVENYALGYVQDSVGNKTLTNTFGKEFYTYYLDGIVGDGMVNSTLDDLLKWDRALYTDKLINAAERKLIFTSGTTTDGKETGYGFGWKVSNNKEYGTIASHSGGWAGYVTYIERHVDHDKTIILLQNNSTQFTQIPAKNIRKILYNEPLPVAEVMKKAMPTMEELKQYEGVYINPEAPIKLTIAVHEGALTAQATGQGAFPMDAYENHTFRFDDAQIKMIFDPAAHTMRYIQGKVDVVFTKE